jgi:CRISPR-associated protein Cas1
MAIVYFTEQHAWVGKEGDCLVVHIPEHREQQNTAKQSERKLTIPLFTIEEVLVFGDITISTPALTSLLGARVPVTYLSQHGQYRGTLSPSLTKNSLLRLGQHAAYVDTSQKYRLAQSFVCGKLRNMRTILTRYERAHHDGQLLAPITRLKDCIQGARSAQPDTENEPLHNEEELEQQSLPQRDGQAADERMHGLGILLGCEGAGSAAYFATFKHLIKCDWPHGFSKRVRRPPTDPVNALLSYGYVLLAAQVASALAAVGFDPYIGYLHASRYGKPALALDLMEEFRPVIVDSVVLSLFNNRQLNQEDFRYELNCCLMQERAKRLFLQRFEERMQETVKHPVFTYQVSYRRCLELQARLLAKYLLGEIPAYIPFAVR